MSAGHESATYHQKEGHVGTAVARYLVVRNCYSKAQKDGLGTDSARTAKEDYLSRNSRIRYILQSDVGDPMRKKRVNCVALYPHLTTVQRYGSSMLLLHVAATVAHIRHVYLPISHSLPFNSSIRWINACWGSLHLETRRSPHLEPLFIFSFCTRALHR